MTADDRTSDTDAQVDPLIWRAAGVIGRLLPPDDGDAVDGITIARALASVGLLANNTRHDPIIEAAIAWREWVAENNPYTIGFLPERALIAAVDALEDNP